MEPKDDYLIIKPGKKPREGWDNIFKSMAEKGDDELLDKGDLYETNWDKNEWEW